MLGNNVYAYCCNDPVNGHDPMGNCPCFAPGISNVDCGNCRATKENFVHYTHEDGTVWLVRDVTAEILIPLTKQASILEMKRLRKSLLSWNAVSSLIGEALLYKEFYDLVNHGAPWDIKLPKVWESTIGTPFPGTEVQVLFLGMLMTPEQLGNFTYGFLGAALLIPFDVLILGSCYAAGVPENLDDIRNEVGDWGPIAQGFNFKQVTRLI